MSELRGCRSRLCDAVEQLNQLFGMCVLLALLFYNIYVHVVVYLVLTRLIDFIYDSSNEVNLNTTLVWLAIDVFFVATYFHGCITTSLEVEKTSAILSNMSHSVPSGRLRENVYWFLTEVNSRPIIFSAYGVFRIDLPLLFVSIASCAVNMAILLQNAD
ncbi:uncharacterized protein LOC135947364 [Cloeon dipterum]|uniref:uncharacterized protein LOC135947364 n=1 Tax=Cloeon dipterum TaxID=197152 RepID=UPI00322021F9